jgi:hypothetical protein
VLSPTFLALFCMLCLAGWRCYKERRVFAVHPVWGAGLVILQHMVLWAWPACWVCSVIATRGCGLDARFVGG